MANTPHVHAKLIKAWADGAEIEYWNEFELMWTVVHTTPAWTKDTKYRIKPTPKPDRIEMRKLSYDPGTTCITFTCDVPNIIFCFDGETDELKSAKVIVRD